MRVTVGVTVGVTVTQRMAAALPQRCAAQRHLHPHLAPKAAPLSRPRRPPGRGTTALPRRPRALPSAGAAPPEAVPGLRGDPRRWRRSGAPSTARCCAFNAAPAASQPGPAAAAQRRWRSPEGPSSARSGPAGERGPARGRGGAAGPGAGSGPGGPGGGRGPRRSAAAPPRFGTASFSASLSALRGRTAPGGHRAALRRDNSGAAPAAFVALRAAGAPRFRRRGAAAELGRAGPACSAAARPRGAQPGTERGAVRGGAGPHIALCSAASARSWQRSEGRAVRLSAGRCPVAAERLLQRFQGCAGAVAALGRTARNGAAAPRRSVCP